VTAAAIDFRDVTMTYPVAGSFAFAELRRRRNRCVALQGMTFSVVRGARLALFGQNGAGKSTLLRLAAGMLIPSAGSVLVDGSEAIDARVRRRVGYVFGEERSFYWRLTGVENLRFFAALQDLFGRDGDREVTRVIHAVGLGSHAHRRVAEYSAGMRQRLAIARGLIGDPKILLLDEPTRSLDPPGADSIHALVRGALAADRTLVVATNRFEDAAALCSSVAVIRDGRIVAEQALTETALDGVVGFVRRELSGERMDER